MRYIGPTDRGFCVKHGGIYRVSAMYPQPITKAFSKERGHYIIEDKTLHVCVSDPHDDFGGVIGFDPLLFEVVEGGEK